MTHFVVHVTTAEEIAELPKLATSLQRYFPASQLHVFNQTLLQVPDSIVCENIKQCGFGWTLRFLRHVLPLMAEDDLLVKVDTDTEIMGNPIEGVALSQGCFFGQMQQMSCCELVFFGGFQGFTYEAVKAILRFGPQFEDEVCPQDVTLGKILDTTLQTFITLPDVKLWADPAERSTALVVHWKTR